MGEKQDKLKMEMVRLHNLIDAVEATPKTAYSLGQCKGIIENIRGNGGYLAEALAERAEEEGQALHEDGWRAPGEKSE